MPGGFLIYYAERGEEIIYANRSLLRIFGCETMEEFRAHTGNSFRGIVHPDELEAVEKSIWAQIASSQYDLDYVEYRICCRDGSTRWIEDYGHYVDIKGVGGIFYVFLGDATGKRARMLEGKNRLISEGLEAEQKFQTLLSEALAKANLAVSSKNAFLSNISHDMRTPLHAIFGFTSLAKMNLDNPEEARNYLSRVETSSQQLLDMINKVLEISAMTDSEGMEETRCSLREIADEVYEFLRPQAREKNLVFRLDCGSLTHNAVFADRDKLRQLILYLSNNAVTYTNPGGQVTVSITEGENLPNDHAVYRFVIQDTGIGISPEFLDQIFEPFSREKNSTLSGIHGIGLGLTVAKNIADLMGGHIDVKSIVGGRKYLYSHPYPALSYEREPHGLARG